jgi:hypothetical protein
LHQVAVDFCLDLLNLKNEIRFVGLSDRNTGEFIISFHKKSAKPLLTHREKTIMRQISGRGWDFRKSLEAKIDNGIYAIEKYDEIKRITIPLSNKHVVIITAEPEANHEQLISPLTLSKCV